MGQKEILGGIFQRRETEDLPDDVTRDNYLRSLRRQRRTQLEELEKEQLRKDIREFEENKTRRNIYDITPEEERAESLRKAIEKKKMNMKINLMKQKISLMKAKSIFQEKSMFSNEKGLLMNNNSLFKAKKKKNIDLGFFKF